MRFKPVLTALMLLMSFTGSQSQHSTTDERIFVHTDKPFYLTGESLWFAAYCVRPGTGEFSDLSRVLYVELFNHNNEAVAQLKVPVFSGASQGQISLPTNLASGIYLLRAYTAWMVNRDYGGYYHQSLFILNPLTGLGSDHPSIIIDHDTDSNSAEVKGPMEGQEIAVELTSQEEAYTIGELVDIELVPGNQTEKKVSVSVYPYHPSLENQSAIARWFKPDTQDLQNSPESNMVRNYPETTGHIVYGRQADPENSDDILVSVGGANSRLYQVIDLGSGNFVTQLPLNLHYDHLYFWSISGAKPEILVQSPFDTRQPQWPGDKLKLDSSAVEFVEGQSINMQVSNLYRNYNKIYGELPKSEVPGGAFYGQPDFQYHLDDYTRFPGLEEVFREYIRYVSLRRKAGKINFFVWDYYANHQSIANNIFFDEPALIMLDGIPVGDMDWLLQLDPMTIETIEIVATRYFLGNQVFYGIVNIKSYHQAFLQVELPEETSRIAYTGLNTSPDFHNPQQLSPDRIPDSRNTLFWNPRLELNGEPIQIRFNTGNTPGKFKIEIRGFSSDGQTVYTTKIINVVETKDP